MVKTICVCDKCGKEIEESRVVNGLDFCEECYGNLCDVIQSWISETAELPFVDVPAKKEVAKKAPAKMEKKSTKRIDWDKACALKIAGWKNHDIADELKCSRGTIDVCIAEKVARYKDRKAEEEEQAKKSILEDK